MRTIYLLVAFDGTEFHGWQRQIRGLRTVQGVLEESLRRVVRHEVALIGSGRTDAGVHAAGHVDSFETSCELDTWKFRHAVGSRLPKDVSVIALRDVHAKFHAQHDAVSKLYRYRIFNAAHRPVERNTQRYVYHVWQTLDMDQMRAAARHFVGKKDFRAMASHAQDRPDTVRTILRCDIERNANEIRIDVEGDGFLYNQVRNMVGTLLSVGRGQWEPDHVAEILEGKDRAQAGPTVPAQGLSLQWVRYPHHRLRPATPTVSPQQVQSDAP